MRLTRLFWKDTLTEWADAGLCAELCRTAGGRPLQWEAATITRVSAGYDHDRVTITAPLALCARPRS